MKLNWTVRLGQAEWAPYTYLRAASDELKLLGSVQRGLQVGALAITQDGKYVQVVGDFCTVLNKNQIMRALAKASGSRLRPIARRTFHTPATPVIVKVKRVRIPVMPRHKSSLAWTASVPRCLKRYGLGLGFV